MNKLIEINIQYTNVESVVTTVRRISVHSPLEQFEVGSVMHFQAPILNYTTIAITNFGLYTVTGLSLVIGLHVVGNNKKKLVPSRWTVTLEAIYDTVHGIVKSQLGTKQEQYIPFLYSVFIFILVSNLLSNITYGFAVTSSLVVTLGSSIAIWLGVTLLGIYLHRIHFLTFFVPQGVPSVLLPLLVPIEVVSYASRSVSLGVRLFSNIVAGHALITILASFLVSGFTSSIIIAIVTIIPFTLFLSIVGLEVAVSFIQAYVFTVLTASYIKDGIYLH